MMARGEGGTGNIHSVTAHGQAALNRKPSDVIIIETASPMLKIYCVYSRIVMKMDI